MYYLICSVLFAVNAGLRSIVGIRSHSAYDFLMAAIWLIGSVIWFRRYQNRKKDKEN